MRNFSYIRVGTPEEGARLLAGRNDGRVQVLAGGTDLIPLLKEDIYSPDTLVDISGWAEGVGIERAGDSLVLGARTPLSAIADDVTIRGEYTALTDACRLAATPQLRNMGTIGGNLLQQTRCWYYRGPFDCWLKGGEKCFARDGENEYHSIFTTGDSPCVSAHPSDPAAALLALDASVRFTTSSEGEREMPLEDLYALPEPSRRSFVTLPNNAVITAVLLPNPSGNRRSTYVKAMARAAWGFALTGVAIVLEGEGTVTKARVALSGVAPIPIRAREVEEALVGKAITEISGDTLADLLVAEAQPLSHNGYKVALLRGVFVEALETVCKSSF